MKKEQFEKIKPVGHWVLAMCETGKKTNSMLYMPDSFTARSPYAMCVKAGKDTDQVIKKGAVIIMKANNKYVKDYFRVGNRKLFFIPRQDIHGVSFNGKVYPLEDRVLVERRRDIQTSGLVITPEQWAQEQSKLVEIIRFGVDTTDTNGLKVGDVCRLSGWHEGMFELNLGGRYMLIIEKKHLLYRAEESESYVLS